VLVECDVRVARGLEYDGDRGRRVEVVVDRGDELGKISRADRAGGDTRAARAADELVEALPRLLSVVELLVVHLHLAPVMRLQQRQAERARVAALEYVGEG